MLSKDKLSKVGDKPPLGHDAPTDLDGVSSDSVSSPKLFSKSVAFDSPSQSKGSKSCASSPEFVTNDRVSRTETSHSSHPVSKKVDGVAGIAPQGTTPLQRTPPRAKFKRPRYCHKDRVPTKEENFNSLPVSEFRLSHVTANCSDFSSSTQGSVSSFPFKAGGEELLAVGNKQACVWRPTIYHYDCKVQRDWG